MTRKTWESSELDHFQNLASTWWDQKGPFRVLHGITPLRMAFLKEKISVNFHVSPSSVRPFQGLRILDIGCGGGLLCEPMARLGAEVTGIDPVRENIITAKVHARDMGLSITYLPVAIEDLPQDLPLFDVIVISEILEHVKDVDAFLQMCLQRLQPQGGIVITTLNKTLKSFLFGIVAAEYILKWAPPGTHSWNKFITPQTLSQKLRDLGIKKQEITGLNFSPLSREWFLSPSTDINYFLWGAR